MSETPARKPDEKPPAKHAAPLWQAAGAKPIPSPAPPPSAAKPATPPASPGLVIQGVKPAAPVERPDARKILESTKGVLGRFLAPVTSKLTGKQAHPETPAVAAAPAPEAPAPSEAPPAPKAVAAPPPRRDLNVPHDRIVLRVAPGTAAKANSVLVRKGIRNAKITGDTLEFEYASQRVTTVFKALLETHIELYGLERTNAPPREPAATPPTATAPLAPDPAAPPEPPEGHS